MKESEASLYESEVVKEARELSKGVFGILPEESFFPDGYVGTIDNEYFREIDDVLKNEVERVLETLGEEKIFVVQRLGLPHAIHNTPMLQQRGFDTYLAQTPPSANNSKVQQGSYNFTRNAAVWKRNREEVRLAKRALLERGAEGLRGVVLSIDAHAQQEDYEGAFDRFFPTVTQLRELGIEDVIFLDETSPQNSTNQQSRINLPPKDWDKSHVFSRLRDYKNAGLNVRVFGVDSRHE